MAEPGADRRESTDGRRMDGVGSTTLDRPGSGGLPTVFDSDDSKPVVGVRDAAMGPFADNTGRRDIRVLCGSTETDDGFATEPPAIEVATVPAVVTESSDGTPGRRSGSGGNFGGTRQLSMLVGPRSRCIRRAVIVE
jgi:hypothetical protein